ncbi:MULTISPECIES: NAD-dependent succinate-semialdehyde dehydrogenase [unclassified Rathayibacter]|uniref:NAD-dependent succinate-semialdehyde dehydrogenase n=1 Tax=unclassified Rathayibacter TaxID=2609250 RepID=UPI00188B13E9|nr:MULTISPECIES: NAD-dependent succinate-semialdehyde dehydrogenase [unclassified Rathayibacter]MBF4462852.1 NAD-dependent succinate-semialdehyde dehydrogenase [Rathayibacter sp. VKM Ac-2879]MBF4504266.1 NAD-dependent succinate-semialdehyde dehydrogenase [Rathayibacter sp. VKM Ac-2878]
MTESVVRGSAERSAAEIALLARVPSKLLIGGAWVDASGGRVLDVEDPSTEKVLASVADATPDDGLRALDAAVAAGEEWAATPPRARGEILRRAFDLLQERKDDFALLMSLEMGKPLAEARGEVAYGGEFLRWFSEEAVRISGRYGVNPEGTGRMIVSQHAVGPCYLITPWNFPLAMATRKIAPALAAGCTVVVKPAELTPLTTLAFAALLGEAGLPDGVINVITTSQAGAVSEPLLADRRLRKLSFTGSTPVGRTLLRQASENVLRTSMELGGNAPFLVFEDADLERAVEGAMQAKFRNIGQACTAANRFFVHESVAEEFAQRVTERVSALTLGRGSESGVSVGPLIDDRAVAKARSLVEDALERGARLRVGGGIVEGSGHFFEATVLTDVPTGSELHHTEIFGPVLAITTFRDEDDAVALANDTEFGLVSYVFTRDLARGQRMIERLATGMMGLNVGVVSNAAAPFGGVKQSGLGREGGLEGIHEYLDTKYTLTPDPFG